MPSQFLRADDFPTFTGQESPQEQIRLLHNYLFSLRAELVYLLRNLSGDNFNETALQTLAQSVQTDFANQVQALQAKLDALAGAVQTSETGTVIGAAGKTVNLIGNVYINGVLIGEEAQSNETA